jgi:hypothetical protein
MDTQIPTLKQTLRTPYKKSDELARILSTILRNSTN